MDHEFTWEKINLMFPEYFTENGTEIPNFKSNPEIKENRIRFLLKDSYGVEIFVKEQFQPWLKELLGEGHFEVLENNYKKAAGKVYQNVKTELGRAHNVLEGWRPLLQKYEEDIHKGNLQTHIEFTKQNDKVLLFDYYRLNSDGSGGSLIEKLKPLAKVDPKALSQPYSDILENLEFQSSFGYDGISGKNLNECISNADRIYKIASEITRLRHPN